MHTVTLSNEIYTWLRREADRRGLDNIERLLEEWRDEREAQIALDNMLVEEGPTEEELRQRRESVLRIRELHDYMAAKYGDMGSSVELIREDRAR